ncbi:MAG TPA: hypothetical protein H9960_00695 [Candidatus Duodenibacillus intestinigallinarum]|jgi:hypothetical protein|nr:hypothetical protein [Candidatus Duodenibacillus intestinigallinarum]
MSTKQKTDDYFDNIDLLALIERVVQGRASDNDYVIFASFCGKGLRDWQDIKRIIERNREIFNDTHLRISAN